MKLIKRCFIVLGMTSPLIATRILLDIPYTLHIIMSFIAAFYINYTLIRGGK